MKGEKLVAIISQVSSFGLFLVVPVCSSFLFQNLILEPDLRRGICVADRLPRPEFLSTHSARWRTNAGGFISPLSCPGAQTRQCSNLADRTAATRCVVGLGGAPVEHMSQSKRADGDAGLAVFGPHVQARVDRHRS